MHGKIWHLFNPKCKNNHWHIKEGQLILATPTGKDEDTAKSVIRVLEAQIRLQIYDAICDWSPTTNRKAILKTSAGNMDNALLAVQAICADIALGKKE
jgi:hypothetical protein